MQPPSSGTMFMQSEPGSSLGRPNPIDAPAGKEDPVKAGYGDGSMKCDGCINFDGANVCDIVAGDIDPNGHCRHWEAGENQDAAAQDLVDDVETP